MNTQKYYSLTAIKKKKAVYNVIIGERSNGKTYTCLLEAVRNFFKNGSHFAYIRRWQEDVRGRRGQALFSSLVENGEIERLSKGKFTGVHFYAGKFYFCTFENGKAIYNDLDVFGYAFALSSSEHDKSTSYPKVETVIFDEFLTGKTYLPDEFVLFMNVLSTIVRKRTGITIYMLGNTVNKYSPYFSEMGLTNVSKQKQGTIDVYKYGSSDLSVAVEYCSTLDKDSKANSAYFAFDNSKLAMITTGAWELDLYPHLPVKYKPKDVLLIYFIVFDNEIYQANIVCVNECMFTFIHTKTTEIRNDNENIIYTLEHNIKRNYNRNILKPRTPLQKKILRFFQEDRVFYQNNSVGNAIHNYLKICAQ